MKNLLIRFVFLSMVAVLINGCKKTIEEEVLENKSDVTQPVRTKISSGMITDWLNVKMSPLSPAKNDFINEIIKNLSFEKMYAEKYRNEENLVIIPLENEYFSQHAKKQQNKPLQYLLIIETEQGTIRKGDLVLFYPDDANLKKLPANSFHDFFIEEDLSVNGTFTLVSLNDVKQFEMIFKNGKKDKFNLWQGEKKSSSVNSSSANSESQTCTNWYLITTYYVNGEVVDQTVEFLGTTCSGSGGSCPPDTECIAPEQTGGGEAPDLGVAVTVTSSFTVKRELTSYEDWEIKPTFQLSGQAFTNSSSNYFTGIVKVGTAAGTSACTYYGFTASSNWPQSSRYSIYSEISHQCAFQTTTATASLICKMYYPNWPASWNPPGQGPSKTDYYSKGNSWQASIALY